MEISLSGLERLEKYLISCLSREDKSFFSFFLRAVTKILSYFYFFIIRCAWFTERKGLACPVISIGNIQLGGTGKTPAAQLLGRMLKHDGHKVAILSRGYGRKATSFSRNIGLVSDWKSILLDPRESGDEPQLLARNLRGVSVVVGRDRFKTGKFAIENLGADVLILDDGYQYRAIRKDLEIATIDAKSPFGNGYLFPRGTLREPRSALSRAKIFLLTHVDEVSQTDSLKSQLRSLNPGAVIVASIHSPLCLENIVTGERFEPEYLKRKRVLALCAIARPESFLRNLKLLGAEVVDFFAFPDHHNYSQKELDSVCSIAESSGVSSVITTQKDAMHLFGMHFAFTPFFSLIIEIQIRQGSEVLSGKLKALFEKGEREGRRG